MYGSLTASVAGPSRNAQGLHRITKVHKEQCIDQVAAKDWPKAFFVACSAFVTRA